MKRNIYLIIMIFSSVLLNGQNIIDNIGSNHNAINQVESIVAKTPATIVENEVEKIWLADDNGGTVPTDLLYYSPSDKIFVYGKRFVLVIDATSNQILEKISLSYNSNGEDLNETTQYYPTIEQTEYLNYSNLTYNEDDDLIYCLSEDLGIYSINPTSYNVNYLYKLEDLCGNFTYKNSGIKYDKRLNRLYTWYSKIPYYGHLKVTDVTTNYSTVGLLTYSSDEIRGLELNEIANEFYISLNNRFLSIGFDPASDFHNNNITSTQIGSTYASSNTAGNLLYIKDNNHHKLFCFPTREIGSNQSFYMKNLTTGIVSAGTCPSGVTAACYNGSDKVYFSYKSTSGNADFRTINVNTLSTVGTDIDSRNSGISGPDYTLDMDMLNGQVILTKESEVTLFNPSNLIFTQLNQGENNYFSRVATNSSKSFVIGTWSTELDTYNTSGQLGSSLEIGGIIYSACHNIAKNKIYFYNTHVQENAKIYILNTTNNVVNILEMSDAICDIEIHPLTNNALISSGGDSDYIKVVDGTTDVLLSQSNWIQLNHDHIGEMYISTNNNLYALITEATLPSKPGIETWSLGSTSNTYVGYKEYTALYTLTGEFTSNKSSSKADPDYVYALIDGIDAISGVATKFNDQQYSATDFTIANGGFDIEYLGKYVYIAISNSTSDKIIALDQTDWSTNSQLLVGTSVSDMNPNPDDNSLYVLNNIGSDEKGVSKISGTSVLNNTVNGLYKESSVLKYNSDNKTLYIFVPAVNDGCVYKPGGLYEVFEDELEDAGYIFFPNDERHRNRYSGTLYYPKGFDLIIDNQNNKVYYGGGGHSCVFTQEMFYTYKLLLQKNTGDNGENFTWLSIPRHYHDGGTILPNSTPTSIVFDQSNIDESFTFLKLDYNNITAGSGSHSSHLVWAKYHIDSWSYSLDGNMNEIISPRGHIIELDPTWDDENYINLSGSIEPATTTFPIYCGEENWIGYFIPETQDVFDALGDELSNINVIKHQTYTCARSVAQAPCLGTKSSRAEDPKTWVCSGRPNINYGDMIMVTPISDATMEWNWSGNPPSTYVRPDIVYYDPKVEATYTTLTIELDTTENPQEIAAFVNDTCVGACSVMPDDTIVAMMAYLGETSADSVIFKQHFASRDIQEQQIKEYTVLNFDNMQQERTALKSGKNQSLVVVSLKNNSTLGIDSKTPNIEFNIYPNPSNGILNYVINLESKSEFRMEIFNLNGQRISTPINTNLDSGSFSSTINLNDNSGNKLVPGLYVIKVCIGNASIVKKLIIE